MPHRAVIGLGSNQGCREFYLALSIRLIEWKVGCVVQTSSVIETPSWGFEAPPFLNQVIVVDTELSPLQLLDTLQSIERQLGRTQKSTVVDGKPVYHNRTIDLDILDYDRMKLQNDRLTLPHPHIAEREFVLVPLRELGIDIGY
jgi:2-amino-4-hydroxy-6-hydroxymethyldihydropteridine diphosphokinase